MNIKELELKISLFIILCVSPCTAFFDSKLQIFRVCGPEGQSHEFSRWVSRLELELDLADGIILEACDTKKVSSGVTLHFKKKEEIETKVIIESILLYEAKSVERKIIFEEELVGINPVLFVRMLREEIYRFKERSKQPLVQAGLKQLKVTGTKMYKKEKIPLFLSSGILAKQSQYQLKSPNTKMNRSIQSGAYPEVTLSLEYWFFNWSSFFVSSQFAMSPYRFILSNENDELSKLLWSKQFQLYGGFKLRHLFENGVSVGLFAGYWYQFSYLDGQSFHGQDYNYLPDYSFHAPFVGGECGYETWDKKASILFSVRLLPYIFLKKASKLDQEVSFVYALDSNLLFKYLFHENWFVQAKIGVFSRQEWIRPKLESHEAYETEQNQSQVLAYDFFGGLGVGYAF